MRKTSVFLEDQQAVLLKRAANTSGRSQAELIREGIDMILAQLSGERPPRARNARRRDTG